MKASRLNYMRWDEREKAELDKAAGQIIASGCTVYSKAKDLKASVMNYRTLDSIRRTLQNVVNREIDRSRDIEFA